MPIAVAQIPTTGLHRSIEPNVDQAAALGAAGGFNHIADARADLTVMPERGDRIRVRGRINARVGQTCVVTLEPIENMIDEPIDLVFAPPEHIPAQTAPLENGSDSAAVADPPEPIENGVIDLGRVAADALFLGLDPYPRKAGAVFSPLPEPDDPEDHPFAALKGLASKP